MLICGSTSILEHVSPGVVLKQPIRLADKYEAARIANCFSVERRILERLGPHVRIVRYLGSEGDGILLGEASHGDLQTYLDEHPSVDMKQRLLWCRQIAEAIEYIHSRGVVHSDLRPANVLVHETTPGTRDLQLSDFGGSVCQDLKADGYSLPDGPFYSPLFGSEASTLLDLFGMGSLFYTILTGRWPYKATPGRFAKLDDRLEWEERVVYPNFKMGKFPPVEHLPVGEVILKCWRREFGTAKDVLLALDTCFSAGQYFHET
ncbi:kinase-like protein [Thermothelomyces heterothallicus CBS 203.75]